MSRAKRSNEKWSSIAPSPDFGKYISLSRFKTFRRVLPKVFEDEGLRTSGDPWWQWEGAVREFNMIHNNLIRYSNILCADEAMSSWCPQTSATGGLDNISFIARKPEPLGTEFKCAVCPVTRLLVFVEIQRGKIGMKKVPYHKELGAGASCVKRMASTVEDEEDRMPVLLVGDAWFGSVRSVVNLALEAEKAPPKDASSGSSSEERRNNKNNNNINKHGIFIVKTAHSLYPKHAITDLLNGAPGGSHVVLKATHTKTGTPLVAVGYKYSAKTTLRC